MEKFENIDREIEIIPIEIWDNSKRAKSLMIIYWILTGLTVLGVVSGYYELELLKSVQFIGYIDESEANANDLRQGLIGILQFGIYIASIVFFLNWFRRAYGNLHRLGIGNLKHNEKMAILSWFIPVIFLFRPVQIMNEIWKETQEQIKKLDPTYIIKSGGLLIGIWWTLFLISNFIGRYVLKTAFKQDTIDQLIEGSQATMISGIMQIPESLLVILIVYQISKMEIKLIDEVKKSGGNVLYK